ncbi:SCO family protein [Bacillus sp. JCM 19041]|uniref:SCO family protein n=1 Tax=Bacillus sp. JCM 19041 TaxID=1460637 RepID=UPI0006D0FAA2
MYDLGKTNSEFDVTEAGMSISDFEFVNQNGDLVSSEDLSGEYWLADMVFTACPTVCPVMTPNMRELQDEAIKQGVDMKFISFSIDPENDTVEHLKPYTERMGVNDDYWSFLTGYELEEIKAFSMENFKSPVERTENDFLHSTRFFLINGEGDVVRAYDGMAMDLSDIKEDLIETVKN